MLFRKNKKTERLSNQTYTRSPQNTYYRGSNTLNSRSNIDTSSKTKYTKSNKLSSSFSFTKLVNIVILVSLVFVAFLSLTMSTNVIVLQSDEDTFVYRDKSEYQEFAQKLMEDNLNYRTKATFRSLNFEEEVLLRFPEIRRAEALLPIGGRNLTLSLTAEAPLAVIVSGSTQGVVDGSGVLSSVCEGFSCNAELSTITFSEAQEALSEGDRLLTANEVQLIRLLESELESLDKNDIFTALDVERYTLSIARGRLEAYFKNETFYVRFSTFGKPEEQVGKFKAVLERLAREEQQKPSTYIDVRVEGRAFVL